ncbi:MAG: 16S rRNA (guanine(966)-N(2))-methyltransferase RsmD [Elainellaceae cyanobacterium]
MTLRISGNRRLKTLPGQHTRPTPARVREALFNMLQGGAAGGRWLDLCAGSGAVGAEALCRGASYVLGIERSGPACAIVTHNWQQVAKVNQRFDVVRGDVVRQLARLELQPFDYIYFDPPYASNLYEPTLTAIAARPILKQRGTLVVEHSIDKALPNYLDIEYRASLNNPSEHPQLNRYRQKTYGRTQLSFYGMGSATDATGRLETS